MENVRDLKIPWLKRDGKCKRLKGTLVIKGMENVDRNMSQIYILIHISLT